MGKPSALAAGLRKSGATVAAAPSPPAVSLAPAASQAVPLPPEGVRAKSPLPPSRIGTKAITVHLPSVVRRQIKSLAADLERDVQDLVSEGLNLVFAKYGRPEISPRKAEPNM